MLIPISILVIFCFQQLEKEGTEIIRRFEKEVLENYNGPKLRRRIPVSRFASLTLNNKLLRTLKPEQFFLRPLLHCLQRLDWDGIFASSSSSSQSSTDSMTFAAMHKNIQDGKYENLEQFMIDFQDVLDGRFVNPSPSEEKQALRIKECSRIILLGIFSFAQLLFCSWVLKEFIFPSFFLYFFSS